MGRLISKVIKRLSIRVSQIVLTTLAIHFSAAVTRAAAADGSVDNSWKSVALRLEYEFNPAALRLAAADIKKRFPDWQPPVNFEDNLQKWEKRLPALRKAVAARGEAAVHEAEELLDFSGSILLSNPLLADEKLLCLSRSYLDPAHKVNPGRQGYLPWGLNYGLTVNWACDFRSQNTPSNTFWQDEIRVVPVKRKSSLSAPSARSLFKPDFGRMLQHLELHFDGERILFTMGDNTKSKEGSFQVYEMPVSGGEPRRITMDTQDDVDNGDACYLPDGRIIFNSTRSFQGVPCNDGSVYVSGLCLFNPADQPTRMLTFDQESNFHPSVLNDGRVLYSRYEYINVSHQFACLLFQMNPDGTNQREYYGSNSYWPNRIFHARAIPGHPTKVVGIVCGHHGSNKTGPLVVFDPVVGRKNSDGVVHTIPDLGKKVEPIVADELYHTLYPKFLHPWPLNDTYFIVSARLRADQEEYALYLVDVFGNYSEICRLPGYSLMDPIPLKKRAAPPIIPDRIDASKREARVLLLDVYQGPGLQGVPKGSIKQLRLFSFNYYYRNGQKYGHLACAGVDGPWEPRYLLGTVPVYPDGSAHFNIPANLPIAIQPLDVEGRAVAQMRSWFTAMPGEFVSCVGCHEAQNSVFPSSPALAAQKIPNDIMPSFGPPRGYDFEVEIQPLLDRRCVGCHDGKGKAGIPDFSRKTKEDKAVINKAYVKITESTIATPLTPSYIALHPYVYRPGAESNYRLQVPGEWCADVSPLIQMLKKGHHNAELTDEEWRRLYIWIDLHAPDLGSWKFSEWGVVGNFYKRRLEEYRKGGNRMIDVEWIPDLPTAPEFIQPTESPKKPVLPPTQLAGWPFDAQRAKEMQQHAGLPEIMSLDIDGKLRIELVLIPPGAFVMGRNAGAPDEGPAQIRRVEKPFYMSRFEINNALFRALADPSHFSGFVSYRSIDWRGEGHPLDGDQQPVVRISWHQAVDFCRLLSERVGKKVMLPTEVQWEWACRAGSDKAFWYGDLNQDFSKYENLAGREKAEGLAYRGKPKWFLHDARYSDQHAFSAPVGSYSANPWGLYDMHGNVCEWTRDRYVAKPGEAPLSGDTNEDADAFTVRGGSWDDRPERAVAAFRWKYPGWRKIHNVGFRIVVEP